MHLKKIKILLLSTAILIAQQKNQPNIYASEIVSLITESDITIYEKKNGEYIKVEKPGKDATEIQIVLSGYKKELCWLKDYTKIESLKIYNLDNNTDLSFLPYLTNLKKFTIYNKNNLSLKEFLLLMYFEDEADKTFNVEKICNCLSLDEESVLVAFDNLLSKNLSKALSP